MNNLTKILIIDDDPMNTSFLKIMLEMEGFQTISASNGQEGLHQVPVQKPDAIILDIMMPVMDGWETYRLLKQNKSARDIPILILTARSGIDDVIKSFELGVVDYICKPFDNMELLNRLKGMIKLKKEKVLLKDKNSHLKTIVKERTQKLLDSAHFATLGIMSIGIFHDLSNLLSSVMGNNQLRNMSDDLDEIKRYATAEDKAIKLMKNYLNNFKDLFCSNQNSKIVFFPLPILNNIIAILDKPLRIKKIHVTITTEENCQLYGNPDQYTQICINLVLNALDAMNMGGRLLIELETEKGFTITRMKDSGCGIPKDHIKKICDFLFTTKPNGTGIGLFASNAIIKEHNGKLDITSEEGKGSTFSFCLPSKNESDQEKNLQNYSFQINDT